MDPSATEDKGELSGADLAVDPRPRLGDSAHAQSLEEVVGFPRGDERADETFSFQQRLRRRNELFAFRGRT